MAPTVLAVFTFAILLGTTQAFLVLRFGDCPDISSKRNFDLNRYLGTWYSYTNFDAPYQYNADCVTAQYKFNLDGSIQVNNTGARRFNFFGTYHTIQDMNAIGRAVVVDPDVPGALRVQFPGAPEDDEANYLVVDTDYDSYSLVWSCVPVPYLDFLNINIESAWILTRDRGVRPTNLNSLKMLLRLKGVNVNNFKDVNNEKCD